MSVNPIEENSTPKPTGSLEDLFRHHLGEEAAVPPRPMLWDQIDNSLLIRQNELYRRRLVATRWVAAASLVLASLAGTGWWAHRASDMAGAGVATVNPSVNTGAGASAAGTGTGTDTGGGAADASEAAPRQSAAAVAGTTPAALGTLAAGTSATQGPGFGRAATRAGLAPREGAVAYADSPSSRSAVSAAPRLAATIVGRAAPRPTLTDVGSAGIAARGNQSATGNPVPNEVAGQAASANAAAATGSGALAMSVSSEAEVTQASAAVAAEPIGFLASRTASLSMAAPGAVPNGLPARALPEPPPLPDTDEHKWHYGATYAVGSFNPNLNFSRNGLPAKHGYNPALGTESPALTEAAAAQYREHLRPGLNQRLALLATRRLTGRWSLRTGAEFSQATAQSASSLSFIGEQIPDLGQSMTGELHTTNFRYRLASLPAEVRYADPVKRGWSLYGRLGGVMSVLLGVRSEVDGEPEATKTYSLASASGPYRRLLGSVRGGMGAQYRPGTGNWTLLLGPVAELGLMPLNARPAQSFLAQSRPYSFGVEAGVEFGR